MLYKILRTPLSLAVAATLALGAPAGAGSKADFDRDHSSGPATLAQPGTDTPAATAGRDPTERFIEANVLETLYHEMGHALIDTMDLDVFGPEEFAADFFAAYMIDRMHDDAQARALIKDVAQAYAADGEQDRWDGTSAAMWDLHGKPMQRYFNLVCLYYGADPEARGDAIAAYDLPDARAQTCEDEFAQVSAAWDHVLDRVAADTPGTTITLDWVLDANSHLAKFVEAEVAKLNRIMTLPQPITVSVIPCGEVNAFYDPNAREILICTELSEHLAGLAP